MQNKNTIILMLCILFVTSCFDNSNKDYQKYSREIIGSDEYKKIHKQANDSIKLWHDNNLGYYQYYFGNGKNVKTDILCFNKAKNKLVTGLLEKHINNDAVSEGITFFYGAKIKDTWCFFTGAYIVLPREMYQKDITKPLSFEKLHEIALKEVFSGYLKKKEPIVPFWKFWVKQEYEIDEQYFMKHWNYYGCMQKNNKDEYSQVCSNGMIDSLIMLNVYDNWRDKKIPISLGRDTTDKRIRTNIGLSELWEMYYRTKFPLE